MGNCRIFRGQLGYNDVSRQAFMGGSLLFNPSQPSSGHLMPGVHVAVRLGVVDRTETVYGQPEFSDRMDDARYGFITVTAINTSSVSFDFTEFGAGGRSVTTSSHILGLNRTVDINGDGIPDLTFVRPARQRPGMENAMFLTFLSSQETLNTTMYAVLPEQYSRGVFPSGLMGINPDGRFIVTRYEHVDSPIRAAVQGLVYGDFVINYRTGTFQKVTGYRTFRNARMIYDSDITDISHSERTDLYFIVGEFDELLTAYNLFMALPASIRDIYNPESFTNEALVPILNSILESYDLILAIAAVQDIGLTESELSEVRSGIHHIEFEDLVQINRLFLNDIFPELSPQLQTNSDHIAFILPLLHVTIRGDIDDVDYDTDVSRRVVNSFAAYTTQRNAIRSEWSRFRSLGGISPNIPLPFPQARSVAREISIGVLGSVENNWGSTIQMTIAAAIFLNLEWDQVDFSTNVPRRSLLSGPIDIRNIAGPSFWIGPVLLSVNIPLRFDVDFGVNGNLGFSGPIFVGFTGLYGAGASVGANYGISWRRVLFVRLPVPFFSPFFNGETISNFAFYIGPQNNSVAVLNAGLAGRRINNTSTVAELTPRVIINPNVSAWNLVSLGFNIETGLSGRFTASALPNAEQLVTQGRLATTGTTSLHYVASLYGTGRVGIDQTVLGVRLTFGHTFTSRRLGRFDTQIGSVRVF